REVVLAERVELDVLHHHHLVGLGVVQRVADHHARVLLVALGVEAERLLDAPRRVAQTRPPGIGIEIGQQLAHGVLERASGAWRGPNGRRGCSRRAAAPPSDPAPAHAASRSRRNSQKTGSPSATSASPVQDGAGSTTNAPTVTAQASSANSAAIAPPP